MCLAVFLFVAYLLDRVSFLAHNGPFCYFQLALFFQPNTYSYHKFFVLLGNLV